jgi:hypothetical protein
MRVLGGLPASLLVRQRGCRRLRRKLFDACSVWPLFVLELMRQRGCRRLRRKPFDACSVWPPFVLELTCAHLFCGPRCWRGRGGHGRRG